MDTYSWLTGLSRCCNSGLQCLWHLAVLQNGGWCWLWTWRCCCSSRQCPYFPVTSIVNPCFVSFKKTSLLSCPFALTPSIPTRSFLFAFFRIHGNYSLPLTHSHSFSLTHTHTHMDTGPGVHSFLRYCAKTTLACFCILNMFALSWCVLVCVCGCNGSLWCHLIPLVHGELRLGAWTALSSLAFSTFSFCPSLRFVFVLKISMQL